MKLRLPAPQFGRLSSSSGRASVTMVIGDVPAPLEHVVDEVEQALIGVVEVLEDHHHRVGLGEPLEERPPGREQAAAGRRRDSKPSRASSARSIAGRSLCVGHVLARRLAASRSRVVASSSVSSRPARSRTISPSAQKVMPSP